MSGPRRIALAIAVAFSCVAANIVTEIAEEYDFVVVGGGLAGLVVGARLSEDSGRSVVVLEAGSDGEEYRDQIDVPGNTYYKSLWDTPLNWGFNTVPQASANDAVVEWPRGKVLGGSSAINGLYLNRPGEIEVNTWRDMLGDMPGADNWTWDSLFAAMKKSETFNPPSAEIAQEGAITWDAASHGTNGPIHNGWPGYTFPMIGEWSQSCANAGVMDSTDTYGGENWGAYVSTSAINPANWTRSYSRSGYLDPLPPRSNYAVLTNAQVTRLLFNSSSGSDGLTAGSVEYTTDNGASMQTVKVGKEVVLCGGSIGSPTVLLYSGVGPADVLSAAGVEQKLDLPVGQYLQDHLSVSMHFDTDDDTAGSLYAAGGPESTDPAFLSYVNDAVAYINASVLFGADLANIQQSLQSNIDQFTPSDSNIAAGYSAITKAASSIFSTPIGQIELLIGNTQGSGINLGATLQHPFSIGSITIASSDPLTPPVINPNYLQNPIDAQVLIAGMKIARLIGQTEPLSSMMTESYPGDDVQSDDDWDEFIRKGANTEYHPCSTCAMLPRNQGGVVDATLKVYGTSNVRVADASVPPIEFSAHLMASTYGLAELAAEIIIREDKVVKTPKKKVTAPKQVHNTDSPGVQQSGQKSGTGSGTGSGQQSDGQKSGDGVKKNFGTVTRPSLVVSLIMVLGSVVYLI